MRRDSGLSLEIRDGYFNVCYRGGSLARVIRKQASHYSVEFNPKYFAGQPAPVSLVKSIASPQDARAWLGTVPHLKDAMDLWFGAHSKDEREYQQLVVRDNNLRHAGTATDYFICDIEYARPSMRFDLVAVHWPSTGPDRKRRQDRGLAVIELKVLDGALSGGAGIAKHLEDYLAFVKSAELQSFQNEMRTVFEQKNQLGLINCQHAVESFMDGVPDYVLLLVNHDPGSRKLAAILDGLPSYPDFRIKVATACFAGYGLYDPGVFEVDEFRRRFRGQIDCNSGASA